MSTSCPRVTQAQNHPEFGSCGERPRGCAHPRYRARVPRSLVIVIASIAFLLTGCEAAPVVPTPTPSPIFVSEAEAARAAEKTLSAYAAAATRMGQSGGVDFSGYDGVVSDLQLADEQSDGADIKAEGHRLIGDLRFFDFDAQTFRESDGEARLTAYACLDTSSTAYWVDASGTDQSVDGHATAVPEVLDFVATRAEPEFVLDGISRWTGRDFCS